MPTIQHCSTSAFGSNALTAVPPTLFRGLSKLALMCGCWLGAPH